MQNTTLIAIATPLVGLLSAAARYIVKWSFEVHTFFTTLDLKVTNVANNVDRIMDNHLPHIYERLGEKFEAGQDKTSD